MFGGSAPALHDLTLNTGPGMDALEHRQWREAGLLNAVARHLPGITELSLHQHLHGWGEPDPEGLHQSRYACFRGACRAPGCGFIVVMLVVTSVLCRSFCDMARCFQLSRVTTSINLQLWVNAGDGDFAKD